MIMLGLLALAAAATDDASDQKMICVRDTRTGSNISHRVCRTAEQMKAQREKAIEAATRMIDMGAINSCGDSAGACMAASEGPSPR
jgi:hypothetical protein